MAEMEFAGVTFKGGKMMVLVTALSTLGGGLWAGFEFYKDYMDMKEVVQNIDVDAIAANNALVIQKADEQMVRIEETIEYTRDIKSGLRDDILGIEKQVDRLEDKVRASEEDVRESIASAEERFENKRDALQNDYDQKASQLRDRTDQKIQDVEDRLNAKLQRALDNPLAN
jgi:LPS O-antigen subunit length determinant protein (WzzB/FepE family)